MIPDSLPSLPCDQVPLGLHPICFTGPPDTLRELVDKRAEDHLEVLDMFLPAGPERVRHRGRSHHRWASVDAGHEVCGPTEDDRPWKRPHAPYLAGRDEVEAIPSIGDMGSWEVPDLNCGIANVLEGPDGTKKCGYIV